MKIVGPIKLIGTTVGAMFGYAIADYISTERPYKAPKPFCGCGHHMSMHDEDGCHHIETTKVVVEQGAPRTSINDLGYSQQQYDVEKFDYIPETCGCRRYMGPNPDVIIPDRASFKKN